MVVVGLLGGGVEPSVGSAAVAGLSEVVRVLASGWSGRGLRVNGVIAVGADLANAAGAARFLVSDASAAVTGQLIRAGEADAG